MSKPFSKISSAGDEYEYLNIRINLQLNNIRIPICAISGVQIYLDVRQINMWHPNIFGYSSGRQCDIQIYSDLRSCPFYDICSPLDL